ncbi:MAG: formate dehydrogenase accessory sulfurtransferase FdhD [Acidobacteriota bacterium]
MQDSTIPGHPAAPQRRKQTPPARSLALTQVMEWEDGNARQVQDYLAAEEPLEIRAAGRPLTVTMRTPGHDRDLAAGLLFTEGFIDRPEHLRGLSQSPVHRSNLIEAEFSAAVCEQPLAERATVAASGCGICGKTSIEALRRRGLRRPNSNFSIDPEILCSLPDRLRAGQQVFGRTGGLHAAALFDAAGTLLALREDIGRHNAVDKIVGWALLQNQLPLSNHVLLVSGRGGFEIAQKTIAAGIPVLASVSAPSSLAVQLAREFDLTLAGFLRGRRFVVYSGQGRIATATRATTPSTEPTASSAA